MSVKIAAFQAQDIQGDVPAAMRIISQAMWQADEENVNVLCFPECFLQGYTLDAKETEKRAFDLASPELETALSTIAGYKVSIILGIIEKDADNYYNTAIVIRHGKILGKYRKIHLFERNFQPGETYPTFTVDNLKFGINICYDARFPEGAAELKRQGAQVIFYPLNNRLPTQKADNYREKHIPNLIARAEETGCWIVSADVYAQEETMTSYGYTAIVSPEGKVVGRVTELTPGMIAQ